MPIHSEVLINSQLQFYRNNFRRLVNFSIILTIIMFGLLGLTFYQHFNTPKVQYFITTSDGRLIEISPIPK